MLNILILIHIIFSILLILLILINKGKGSDSGGIINSSMNDFFGNKESFSILNKLTMFVAILLLFTTILITVLNNKIEILENEPVIKIIKTKF